MTASNGTSNSPAPSAAPNASAGSSSSTGRTARLSGPSLRLDPRTHAYRRDLADIALADKVVAPHYASPVVRSCGPHATDLLDKPGAESGRVAELLPGEDFAVLEYAGGWAWGYACADHRVGYVEAIALVDRIAPTHIVCEKCAPVTPDARVTSPTLASFPMGAQLHGTESAGCLSTEFGCVPLSHLRAIDELEADPAAVAERLRGAPWRDGGRTVNGIDALGLVQLALGLCGIHVPADPERLGGLGAIVGPGQRTMRGDLVLWRDGAGLMIDDRLLIHASRADAKVCIAPLAVIEAEHGALARRRVTG